MRHASRQEVSRADLERDCLGGFSTYQPIDDLVCGTAVVLGLSWCDGAGAGASVHGLSITRRRRRRLSKAAPARAAPKTRQKTSRASLTIETFHFLCGLPLEHVHNIRRPPGQERMVREDIACD